MARDAVFPVFAALGTLLTLLPLTWHARTGNIAMILLIFWISLCNFIQFVNTVIWFNNTDDHSRGWCDLSTRLYLMSVIAIPACTLCIAVRLESIASTRVVAQTPSSKRNQKVFELAMGVLLPLVYVALAIVWQGHRYDIYGGAGCYAATYYSWPWLLLSPVPILVVSCVSLVYSILALRWFSLRRAQFMAVLASSGSNLNTSRYVRMMAFCLVDMIVTIPITVGNLASELHDTELLPYDSWANVHYQWDTVVQIPATTFDAPGLRSAFSRFDLVRWSAPVAALIFFAIFGLTQDAVTEYRRLCRRSAQALLPTTKPKPLPMQTRDFSGSHLSPPDTATGYELRTKETSWTTTTPPASAHVPHLGAYGWSSSADDEEKEISVTVERTVAY